MVGAEIFEINVSEDCYMWTIVVIYGRGELVFKWKVNLSSHEYFNIDKK